ncbi:LuxR C-terminal-related transcriptional regulator [Glaciimonas immobilis]|uniref:LuxR family maltose regulon positive regulatory protein n=1 Tax=Glaciimonas immobilis TaxID=728004 RepID=A0A840RV07_9BURK|nr:LuxR C-terminal-related transcriptional regulator [Glaciimonas immobilis]KAF3997589.1 hypothetical protein HAV38_13035 [Glaciimonas immobilis]MBB5200716.1 LuxR family maltose regulon positive regulatory protein [Glaciimonas immobilis]
MKKMFLTENPEIPQMDGFKPPDNAARGAMVRTDDGCPFAQQAEKLAFKAINAFSRPRNKFKTSIKASPQALEDGTENYLSNSAELNKKPPVARHFPPSKFSPPPNSLPLITRHKVLARMLNAENAKLMVLDAPAGFGKTTLLRSLHDLLTADKKAVAWLTLDAGDNDLDQLTFNLAQALQKMRLPVPLFSHGFETEAFAHLDQYRPRMFDAVVATGIPFVLILDEFEIVRHPAVLSLIQQTVEALGAGQQIIIGCRGKPLINLARLRARQQLLECNATHMRFRLKETTEFLREKRHLKLNDSDLQKLHEITDGWPAALWLSSLALENNPDPRQFIKTFTGSNSSVAAYLAEDVLSQKPQYLQEFILQTSILPQFCIESCIAVTGHPDSKQLLEEIEGSNMFITPLDDQRKWFSYHPLFATFLQSQLAQRHPGVARDLHRRASRWHLDQDQAIFAIDHAVAADDKQLLLELLEQKAEALLLQGRVRLLARWFDTLNQQSLESNSKLIFVYAWVLIHTNRSGEALALQEALGHSDDAAYLRPDSDMLISYPAAMALRTFSLVMLDRIEETAPLWEGAQLLDNDTYEPFLQTMLMIGCAYYYATIGRYQEARQALDRVIQRDANKRSLFGSAVAGYMNSMLDMLQGNFRSAGARLHLLIGEQPPPGGARYGADSGFSSIYLAQIYYETGLLDKAKRLLKLYLPLVKEAGTPDHLITSHLIYARILRAEGNINDALQTLFDMEHLGLQRGLPRLVDMARIERARGAIMDGDLVTARDMLALIKTRSASVHPDFQPIAHDIDNPALALMRLDVHSAKAIAAVPVLKTHLDDAYRRGRMHFALRIKVVYALALANAGQTLLAFATIREALQEALPENFVRIFLDEGPALLALIEAFLDELQRPTSKVPGESCDKRHHMALVIFAEKLLATHSANHLAAQSDGDHPVTKGTSVIVPMSSDDSSLLRNAKISDITERERDVLHLLAKGHGNQLIAEKLFVSVTTVRAHLRNINIKLDAHTRTEAIAIARERAIIR